jgi:Cu+-exporting ATPase
MSSLVALLVVLTVAANAQDTPASGGSGNTPAGGAAPAATNLICPVTGENADPDVSYAYNGTTYHFCCEGCIAKFKKDPEKYIAASAGRKFDACADHAAAPAEDGDKAVINKDKDMSSQISNSVCPVMGKPVDKTVTTVSYKGKVYGFCCKSCIKKFAKDPEKYLKES